MMSSRVINQLFLDCAADEKSTVRFRVFAEQDKLVIPFAIHRKICISSRVKYFQIFALEEICCRPRFVFNDNDTLLNNTQYVNVIESPLRLVE